MLVASNLKMAGKMQPRHLQQKCVVALHEYDNMAYEWSHVISYVYKFYYKTIHLVKMGIQNNHNVHSVLKYSYNNDQNVDTNIHIRNS